jgi:hypothetical protein
MGQTANCIATFKRQTSTGRAEIETDYVLFRGDFRVKLPFSAITGVAAANGVLTLMSTEGTLALSLGPQAEKWASMIRSPKTRAEKIGVKAGQRVSVLGLSDRAFVAELKDAGADVSSRARKESDVIFARIESAADLDRFAALRPSLRPNGAIWAIRRKGVPEASEAMTMAAGKAAGLVDVKVVRFSETHTAEKFVVPLAKRRL